MAKYKTNLLEQRIKKIVSESISELLTEGYLDNIFADPNFQKWFSGSKIVDENGNPLLLGHGTTSFGFKKFNTPFIHLAPIRDASYFSGGNKRMFRFKKTLNRLSDDDVLNLYNKFFHYSYDEDGALLYRLDDAKMKIILDKYEKEISSDTHKKWGRVNWDDYKKALENCKNILIRYYNKNKGRLCCVPHYRALPSLTPRGFGSELFDKSRIDFWLKNSFPTFNQLRKELVKEMFHKEEYFNRGTYALCARVLNPLTINCHGNSWDSIYVRPDSCNAYDELFDKYCELGANKRGFGRGSWFALDNESIAYLAKELGYDGVIFKNIREGADGECRMDTTYIIYSTKQLKSPFENNGEFGDVENLFR